MKLIYQGGYKYILKADYQHMLTRILGYVVSTDFIKLNEVGVLWLRCGYAWDGPSGPAIDTLDFMRGSLIHDVLYQLIRDGRLPLSEKDNADRELQDICLRDGMSKLRAWWVYQAVRLWGGDSCRGDGGRKVIEL